MDLLLFSCPTSIYNQPKNLDNQKTLDSQRKRQPLRLPFPDPPYFMEPATDFKIRRIDVFSRDIRLSCGALWRIPPKVRAEPEGFRTTSRRRYPVFVICLLQVFPACYLQAFPVCLLQVFPLRTCSSSSRCLKRWSYRRFILFPKGCSRLRCTSR